MVFINLNGKVIPASEPVLIVSNRSFRYGDGVFETMRINNGTIHLAPFHFERLFGSLKLLQFEVPKLWSADKLQKEVLRLCEKNGCSSLARVRFSVFRGNGGLYDNDKTAEFVIECWPLAPTLCQLNENGLVIDVFPNARKACDTFSHVKSTSFLPYNLAAQYAKTNKLNDCIVLNSANNVADTTIANIFIVKNKRITTPPISEGCIAGVMRRHLLETLKEKGYTVDEEALTIGDIETADEVFLTNAIRGIQWVKQFRNQQFTNKLIQKISNNLF